jgi:hypothetical protein
MASNVAGSKQSITAISKASQGVLTYSGADSFSLGTYAALTDLFGMTELEDALVKVGTVDTGLNTFLLEDQDTTGYGTFVSGSVAPVVIDTEIVAGPWSGYPVLIDVISALAVSVTTFSCCTATRISSPLRLAAFSA